MTSLGRTPGLGLPKKSFDIQERKPINWLEAIEAIIREDIIQL
jgi:hypothetical protein